MLTVAQKKAAAREFVKRWQSAEGNEDREARSFWIEFAQELLGIPNATKVLNFERRVKGRKIDVFYEDMGVLIENKSRGCSLDERYTRSKKVGAETPYEQAKWYADNLPNSVRPDWIITCNFDEIRIHNLNHVNPGSTFTSVTLEELPDMLYLFGFFTDKGNSRIEKEKQLSIEAAKIVGRLYDLLANQYQNIDTDPHEQRSLNILVTRLVFMLYAEDSGLLSKHGQFYDYLKNVPSNRLRTALVELFDVLDTPKEERDPYLDPELAAFPYINGGLFTHEDIVIPNFTDQIKVDLLAEASAGFDWKDISPTIFGAAFESTLNPETRRAGGMHYTEPATIHRVIDPLFLDDLKAELDAIEGVEVEKKRIQQLRAFQKKISELTFADYAAGSHNFLTEIYVSLRMLEMRVIENIQGNNQMSFLDNPIMVNIGQLYSCEINEFAVSVGKTALWIAEQQMMDKTQELLPYQEFDFLPLKSITNCVCADALEIDWNDILPAERCDYLASNPPFLGYSNLNPRQRQSREKLFGKNGGVLDYVCCWYKKAADYIEGTKARAAFVSTNSICQGQQVAPLWKPLFEKGLSIDFAWRTFVWNSQAVNQAHVHVVIVGFSYGDHGKKMIFDDAEVSVVENINGYLYSGENTFVEKRTKPLSNVPEVAMGFKPADGGFLLLTEEEKLDMIKRNSAAERWIRPFSMGADFINGKSRYCLWLTEATTSDIEKIEPIADRVNSCFEWRSKQTETGDAYKLKETPHLLRPCGKFKDSAYIAIPAVSSERRTYIPMGFVEDGMIPGNKLYFIPEAGLYEFGILMSIFHNAWMRVVTGRLKSDYNYSNTIVYNNFVWPDPTPEQKEHIERCAQLVLDVREQYPDKSLADLYDPDKMPESLRNAHELLDAAVEAAYGVDFGGDEEKIVAHLFKLYAEMTEGE